MAHLAKYNIAFSGLSEGSYDFEHRIDRKFFDYFSGGIVDEGLVNVKITLEKESALMILWFHVKGKVEIQCDRCLDLFHQNIENKSKVFIKYGEENFNEGDDVIWVGKRDSHINVAKLIYDFIILAIPIKHVHPEKPDGTNECNPEMIIRLNNNGSLNEEKQKYDSRWSKLQALLNKNQ